MNLTVISLAWVFKIKNTIQWIKSSQRSYRSQYTGMIYLKLKGFSAPPNIYRELIVKSFLALCA